MTNVRTAWNAWIGDNPFLRRELARWGRRGYAWKMPLWCAGLPAAAVVAVQAFPAWAPAWLLRGLGPVPAVAFFAAASFAQLITLIGIGGSLLLLHQEAAADRLDFIRLLPMGRRELLAKLWVARLALFVLWILVALPIHLLVISLGGAEPRDIAGLYVLLLLMMGPPSEAEVTLALSARRGAAATPQSQWNADPRLMARIIGLQVGVQVLIHGGRRGFGRLGALLGRLGASSWAAMPLAFPFGAAVFAARFVWEPRLFYHWPLAPVWLISVVWALNRAMRLVSAAEIWSREPVQVPLPKERVAVVLPGQTGRPEERRAWRVLAMANWAFWLIALTGYLWGPLVASGALGSLAGAPSPAGSLAVLLLIAGGIRVFQHFDWIRWAFLTPHEPPKETPGVWAASLGQWLAVTVGALAAACALGGASAWLGLVDALPPLAGVAAATCLFAFGWRALLGREPRQIPQRTQMGLSMLDLALYLGPIAVFALAGPDPRLHLLAALSPAYALLALFTGMWGTPGPVSLGLSLGLPAGIGALMLLVAAARRPAGAERPRPEPARRDPLDDYFQERAARWDNPLLTLEAHRQRRRPMGLAAGVSAAFGGSLVLPLAVAGILITRAALRNGASPAAYLSQPLIGGLQVGGIAALAVTSLLLLVVVLAAGLSLMRGVLEEHTLAERQQRIAFLLTTPLPDRDVVLGVLTARAVRIAPAVVGAVGAGFLWCLGGIPYGLPWWAPLAWAWALLFGTAAGLHAALRAFHSWRHWDWARLVPVLLPILFIPMGPFLGFMVPRIAAWVAEHRGLALGIAVGLPPGLAALVPWSFRSAVRAVNVYRSRHDLHGARTGIG